jgi:hypothetical protein
MGLYICEPVGNIITYDPAFSPSISRVIYDPDEIERCHHMGIIDR